MTGDPARPPSRKEVWQKQVHAGEFAVRYKDFKTGLAARNRPAPSDGSAGLAFRPPHLRWLYLRTSCEFVSSLAGTPRRFAAASVPKIGPVLKTSTGSTEQQIRKSARNYLPSKRSLKRDYGRA